MNINITNRLASTAIICLMSVMNAMAGIAVLDITNRNKESEIVGDWSRNLYSATYMCDIAGYDYIVTQSIEEAMAQRVILISSCLTSNSFTLEEWKVIEKWVEDGGVIVAPAFRSASTTTRDVVSQLFGIETSKSGTKASDRKIINWNPDYFDDPELEYIDEEHERATSIGEVKSFSLTATDADILANFDNETPAVVRNKRGNGKVYLAQVAWRDVIQRNQLNKDQKSSRQYNNGFEPSSDVWALWLRSIHALASGVSVWKFTVPGGYTQLLVPTHDCDSKTAYDAMHYMADYEKSLGFRGHYFLTVHYFSDKVNFGHSYLSDFYNSTTIPKAVELVKDGHTMGSHSLCHFPDFNKTQNTDVVTRDEYAQRATYVDGASTGVSTWAEIVLSKQILEEDLGNNVRSFRSGHLCVNSDFHAMLEEGRYSFQSCYTGGDILSEFPFFGRFNNSWEGDQSDVLTIQLHISDVYNNKEGVTPLNDDTWETHPCPDEWFAAMNKLRGNYASAVLLIHPNREWKMTLQKRLVDQLDLNEVGLYNFEDYGDFWLARHNTKFTCDYDNTTGEMVVHTYTETLKKNKLTFAVEIYDANLTGAKILNNDGTELLEADLKQLSDHRYLIIPKIYNYGSNGVEDVSMSSSSYCGIYDINGRIIYQGGNVDEVKSTLPKGIYIVKDKSITKKLRI